MDLRRILVLLRRELVQGKGFILVFAIVTPVALTLLVSLFFGTWFSSRAKLGIVDLGDSTLTRKAAAMDSLVLKQYPDRNKLKQAVEMGAVDFGVELPADFDARVGANEEVELTPYIWGESLLKNRAVASMAFVTLTREVSGNEIPVEVVTTTLGDGESMPWEERLFPFIVLMAIVLGGFFIPATSLVEEKQSRTLNALLVTPLTPGEVYLAKGIFGVLLCLCTGTLILALNRAFGAHPVLLIAVLGLGATMAASAGLLFASFVKNISTLFAITKALGLFLYAPAIIGFFPQIPQWIAKFFPTYYIIAPVVDISQHQATLSEVAPDLAILFVLIAALLASIALVLRRGRTLDV